MIYTFLCIYVNKLKTDCEKSEPQTTALIQITTLVQWNFQILLFVIILFSYIVNIVNKYKLEKLREVKITNLKELNDGGTVM